jgi:uncharacterized protein DUF5672
MVAVVVPLSSRPELNAEEEVSIRHLSHYLGGHDKFLIAPEGAAIERNGFKAIRFSDKFFGSAAAHNRLLMWPGFYSAFREYQYILIYHLDSLVLSDQIEPWCKAGFDYIGAPWVPCPETPWVKEPRVGNGGFTLMRVESVLKVLYNRYRMEPAAYWSDLLMRNRRHLQPVFRMLERLQPVFPKSRVINRPLEDFRKTEKPDIHGCNNDYFWSFEAERFLPGFKVASVEDGLRFAFEAAPRDCFERNGRQLPFGCHAWTKFDRAFWEPYLLQPPAPVPNGAG